jgi:ferredoxin
MRLKIDLKLCQGHGVCEDEAPEVFRVVEKVGAYDHVELVVEEPGEELRPKVELAVRYCPNRVLSIES